MSLIATHTHIDRKTLIILGLVAIIMGLLAILAPTATGISIAMLLGALVTAAGAVRMYWAFKTHNLGRGLILFGIGTLSFLAGLAMMIHPVFASGILTLIFTLYFILDGISELSAAFLLKPQQGWHWMALAGGISILLGFLIWLQFPLSGAWALGILLGIKLLMIGGIILFSRPHVPL